jgi:hypothetical protein
MGFKDAKELNRELESKGYKFLGWQNGWKHVYFDEDGKQTAGDLLKGEKPKKQFGYLPADYPEYCKCVDAGHAHGNIQHNPRGSENTVSCDICKIYWKYDCSD